MINTVVIVSSKREVEYVFKRLVSMGFPLYVQHRSIQEEINRWHQYPNCMVGYVDRFGIAYYTLKTNRRVLTYKQFVEKYGQQELNISETK